MRRHFLVIHNPRAGLKRAPLLMRTLTELEARGCRLQFAVAHDAAEDAVLARQAAIRRDVDAVVAAGGDSTVRGVAGGLIGTSLPLGIIPVGTGNVLAHEIALQRRPKEIAAALMNGPVRPIRLGLANGSPFLVMAGIGFDAETVRHLDHGLKQHVLKAAYVWPALRALTKRAPHLRLEIDGVFHDARFAIVSRVGHYAGNMLLAPGASPQRDDFQVVLFEFRSRFAFLRQLAALATGRIGRTPGITHITARSVAIEEEAVAGYQLDGEWTGQTPVAFAIAPQGLNLILPATA